MDLMFRGNVKRLFAALATEPETTRRPLGFIARLTPLCNELRQKGIAENLIGEALPQLKETER